MKIVNGIKVCMSIEAAAARAGVTRRTVHNWVERGKAETEGIYHDFAEEVDLAMAEAELDLAANVRRAGTKDWRAAKWMLEVRAPERWATRQLTEEDRERKSAAEVARELHALIQQAEATVPSPEDSAG